MWNSLEESFEDRSDHPGKRKYGDVAICLYSIGLSLVVAGTAEVGSVVVAAVVTMVVVVGGLSGSDYPNWQSFESVPATFSFSNSRMFFCHFCGSSFSRLLSKTALS